MCLVIKVESRLSHSSLRLLPFSFVSLNSFYLSLHTLAPRSFACFRLYDFHSFSLTFASTT